MIRKPKVIFLTGQDKTLLIESILNESIEIVALIVPKSRKYQPLYMSTVELAIKNNIPIISVPINQMDQSILNLEFEALFSCGYPFFIPSSVINKAKYAINFHPTLLPRHRGRYVHWVLIDRDKYSGVTAHFIDDGYDTGPIIKQERFEVSPFDTVNSLLRKSKDVEILLMKKIINKVINEEVTSVPQDNSLATEHFKKRTTADSEIDPTKPLDELFYEIRSYDSDLYPAFFTIEGQKVGIKVFRLNKPNGEEDMI